MKNPLKFSKIIPTPTMQAWAQAYNAGNLVAVISLTQIEQTAKNSIPEISLPLLGKDIINTLEAEYFTLETKNLTTIKQAIASTVEKAPDTVRISFCIAVIIENIIYLYLYGAGKVVMKRLDKVGILLEQTEGKNLISGSGYIEHGDVILLQTHQFAETVPLTMISPFLEKDKLMEMTETLSPIIHEKQVGDAAAIAFAYVEEQPEKTNFSENPQSIEKIHTADNFSSPSPDIVSNQPYISSPSEEAKKPKRKLFPRFHFSHTRKLILTIAILVVGVLLVSLFFSKKKKEQVINQALYQQTVPAAQRKYDEAQSLMDLNKNLANEDFENAKNILSPAVGKFPPDSKQNKDVTALMQKIDTALTNVAQNTIPDAKQVENSASPLLAALLTHTSAKYVTQDDKNIYIADNTGITSISKSDAKETVIIKNGNDWKDIGGLGTYLGNFYVLDKSDGILKYVGSESNYSKSNYFSGASPDLSKASAIAIDGSIWIIKSDGTLSKYTRGTLDNFSLKNLDKPMNNPTKIYTTVDATNVYILDNGNKRIIVLDKNGNFLQQYQAGVIGQAQDFDVQEQQKKIYILGAGKIWELDLK